MADPLLTSLCAICHISKPQYKCPRCNIRTCSLACVKKHKAWSECNGERDPTAYMPPSKLRTAAGVDHDYNFLHGIELAAERAERVLVGDKGIIQTEELRPLTMQEVRWKTGRDGRKKKVLVTRVLKEGKGRVIERHLAQRLGRLNIEMVCAPMGLTRQKENHTTLNRRTGRINWQVEWFSWEKQDQKSQNAGGLGDAQLTRVLSKVMDDAPLYHAYHALIEDQAKTQGRSARKVIRSIAQNPSDSRWQHAADSLQDPSNGSWVSVQDAGLDMWPGEKEDAQRKAFQFFLARSRTRSDQPTILTRLDSGDCLRDILTNTRVLEFPTFYVLKDGDAIPSGFTLGPKDVVPLRPQPQQLGGKRKIEEKQGKNAGRSAKRRRPGGKNLEDGEVGSDEGEAGHSGEEENNDEDSGAKGPAGLEAGDVIAEQELVEVEDDGDSDDDTTSSSGSDSD
ncbi:Putative box C/D snoRNA-like protein [Cladobotryum mycophilum]|uniref:Box C/D snoRNA-like protein n=1 Tax=Cladobotryum mycophilum TaxID=491253 RepID=A0ABR0SYB3_9HYPO